MEEKPHPLSDLSFFRFPETTTETVASIIILFILLGLTVLLTILVQRLIHERSARSGRLGALTRATHELRMPAHVRLALDSLVAKTRYRTGPELIADPLAYEKAVDEKVRAEPDAELAPLAAIRKLFHLNLMNPDVQLVSTRQLLRDLPVRVIVNTQSESLDLYCALLEVNEGYLLLDVPPEEDVRAILRTQPRVQMIFWREDLGETVFPLELETMASGDLVLFRANHTFSIKQSPRADFRLSVDFPIRYRYVHRDRLRNLKRGAEATAGMLDGEGLLIDLSYGGASFSTGRQLDPGGFAQIEFSIHEQSVHMMLEVISTAPAPDGEWRHNGQFRGMSQDVRTRVHNYISREQVVRLREKEIFRKG